MTFAHLRLAWRSLRHDPAYALVVTGGLAIGFAAALLLLALVRHAWQSNQHIAHVEQLYVVKQRYNVDPKAPWFDQAPLLLRQAGANAPGVAAATAYLPSRPESQGLTVRIGTQLSQLASLTVMPGFEELLGLQALQGDLAHTLGQPGAIALTQDAARRLFGSSQAVGRTLLADGKLLRVGAIVPTPPANTTIAFEALVGTDSLLADADVRDEMHTGQRGWWGKLLLRLHPGSAPDAVARALQQAIDASPAVQALPLEARQRLAGRKAMDIVLAPLGSAYFDADVAHNQIAGPGERAHPAAIAALAAMAALILALAAVNYVNLATVRMQRRQTEVAMRKVLGAGVRQIVLQLLAESLLVSLAAAAAGLLLAWLLQPLFAELVDRRLETLLAPASIATAGALGLLLGLLTVIYPAWIAIGVRPGHVMSGRGGGESARGLRLRRALTLLQVASAMGLASISVAIAWQASYAMRAAPGFDPAPLLIVDLPVLVRGNVQAQGFIAALQAEPAVAGIAISEDAVGRRNAAWFRDLKRPGGASAPMEMKSVSANFFAQYRVAATAGRLFDPRQDREDDGVPLVLNAIAARQLGFAEPAAALGQILLFKGFDNKVTEKRVIGIAPELRFQSLREPPRAIAYELWTAGSVLSVRATGSLAAVEAAVRAAWPRYFPEAIIKLRPAAAILAHNYADDARMARLLTLSTGIALAIAAFGTYVLSAHTVQRRAREIVLRKLHGAHRAAIGLLVLRETGTLVLLSAALALPLAALAIERYLAGFVERAPVGWWTMLLALAATMAVTCAAAARHAWLAMRLPPAQALRG